MFLKQNKEKTAEFFAKKNKTWKNNWNLAGQSSTRGMKLSTLWLIQMCLKSGARWESSVAKFAFLLFEFHLVLFQFAAILLDIYLRMLELQIFPHKYFLLCKISLCQRNITANFHRTTATISLNLSSICSSGDFLI